MMGTQANFWAIKCGPRRPGPAGFLVLGWKPGKGGGTLLSPPALISLGGSEAVHTLPALRVPAAGFFLHEAEITRRRCQGIPRIQGLLSVLVSGTAVSCSSSQRLSLT